MKTIKDLLNKIKDTKLYVSMMNFVNSIFSKETKEIVKGKIDEIKNSVKSATDDAGSIQKSTVTFVVNDSVEKTVNKVEKTVKKKIKNSDNESTIFTKIKNFVCMGATILFGILIVYAIVRLIPLILSIAVIAFAATIAYKLIESVINVGLSSMGLN